MIFVHIGRGKSGSTTIQQFLERNREVLRAQSVQVSDRDVHSLAQTLSSSKGHAAERANALLQLQDMLKQGRDTTFILSSEYLFSMTEPAALAQFKDAMPTGEKKIITYLREYPRWLVSSYNQGTKKGKNIADFDAYFEKKLKLASALPALRAWADVFGRDNLYIRSVDPAALVEGQLTLDFAKATRIDRVPGLKLDVETMNSSEDWCINEMRRALAGAIPKETRLKDFVRLDRSLHAVVAEARKTHAGDTGNVQYLTPSQWSIAKRLYNEDVKRINSEFPGAAVGKLAGGKPPPRPFLPAVESLPIPFTKALKEAIGRTNVLKRIPPEDLSMLQSLVAGQLKAHKRTDERTTNINPLMWA